MKKTKGRMDESILVCVYYGPNGERLIKRGHKMASIMDCPDYSLTVDPLPYDDFDSVISGYIERCKVISVLLGVEVFILLDNEIRRPAKAIALLDQKYIITQIVIGQTPQNRWEEITKGSFANVLMRAMSFVDIHIVSMDRSLNTEEEDTYEKGVRSYVLKDDEGYRLSFTCQKNNHLEGIFYKEIGTDFNNCIFKFVLDGKPVQVHVTDDRIKKPDKIPNKPQ